MRHWDPIDYFGWTFLLLISLLVGRIAYVQVANRPMCHAICAPQNAAVDAEIFGSDVSCICDLTKERIEIP